MPIHMEISPLHRLVTIDEVRNTVQKLAVQTAHEGPVDLFESLHEARAWVARIQHAPKPVPATAAVVSKVAQAAADAWADPDQQGTVIRGTRTREFTTRELVH